MDRTVWLEVGGKEHPLRFSFAVTEIVEEKYKDFDGMVSALTQGDHRVKETLDMILILNHQACSWLNSYAYDLPKKDGAQLDEDGNYMPLDREYLANALERDSYGILIDKITEAFVAGKKNEIEGKETAETKRQKKKVG